MRNVLLLIESVMFAAVKLMTEKIWNAILCLKHILNMLIFIQLIHLVIADKDFSDGENKFLRDGDIISFESVKYTFSLSGKTR